MRGGIFFPLSLISILVWNGLLLFLGLGLGQNWAKVVRWFRVYNWVMVILVILAALFWTGKRWGLGRSGRGPESGRRDPS
jgi:membrane protein DedA with SNARE-associated domain